MMILPSSFKYMFSPLLNQQEAFIQYKQDLSNKQYIEMYFSDTCEHLELLFLKKNKLISVTDIKYNDNIIDRVLVLLETYKPSLIMIFNPSNNYHIRPINALFSKYNLISTYNKILYDTYHLDFMFLN